jgi:nicotinate-nucleotide adenylyltransferase
MNIGLYFGSFNPIHVGHLIIAAHVLDNSDLQKIWFVVSPQNPLKETSSLLNEKARFHLVQLAIDDNRNFRASNIEFALPKPSYTIDTLTYLQEKYPQHCFSIIMGGDSLQNLPKWKNYQTLLDHYKIYVFERPGYDASKIQHKNIVLLKAPLLEISATLIREKIKRKHDVQYLLHPDVKKCIEESGYYR